MVTARSVTKVPYPRGNHLSPCGGVGPEYLLCGVGREQRIWDKFGCYGIYWKRWLEVVLA